MNKSHSSCWDGRPCQSKVGRKVGAAVPLSVGELGHSLSNTMYPGPRPTSVPSGFLDMGKKVVTAVPFLGGGTWVRIWHNVAWTEAYLRTFILIHPAVWPHKTVDMGRNCVGEAAVPLPFRVVGRELGPHLACDVGKVILQIFQIQRQALSKTVTKLEALGQYIPPPRLVLPVSRYGAVSVSGSVIRIATKI